MDVGLFTLAVLAHLVAEMVHNILIIQFGENSDQATQSGAIVNYMKQKMQDFGDVEHNVVQQVNVAATGVCNAIQIAYNGSGELNFILLFNLFDQVMFLHENTKDDKYSEYAREDARENMLAMIDGKLNLANFCSVVDREISDLTEQSAAFNVGGVDGGVDGRVVG